MTRKEWGMYGDKMAGITLYILIASFIALVILIENTQATFWLVRVVYLSGVLFMMFSGIEIWATRYMPVIWGEMSPQLAEKYGIAVAIMGGLGVLLYVVNILFIGL